ncbi:ZC3H3 protein, partial [Bucco capensis]|nr:ZC3H3 protein [Bucco capensis]
GGPSESAVTLKSEPQEQQPLVSAEQKPAQHLVQRKAEAPAPAQPGCEQVREAKLSGGGEMNSRPSQAAAVGLGMTPTKSKFSVAPKASGLQRSASASISSKSPKFKRTTYTWVANPGKCSRALKRWSSPRASEAMRKLPAGVDRSAKLPPKADLGAKLKKSALQCKVGVSSSKYKWKASSLQSLPSTSKSAFRWQSEEQKKPPGSSLSRAGAVPPPLSTGGAKCFGDASLSSYKVKSRTKIIKRKGNSSSPPEKRSSSSSSCPPQRSQFQLRRKMCRGKAAVPAKRCPARGLLQLSKHRLCSL